MHTPFYVAAPHSFLHLLQLAAMSDCDRRFEERSSSEEEEIAVEEAPERPAAVSPGRTKRKSPQRSPSPFRAPFKRPARRPARVPFKRHRYSAQASGEQIGEAILRHLKRHHGHPQTGLQIWTGIFQHASTGKLGDISVSDVNRVLYEVLKRQNLVERLPGDKQRSHVWIMRLGGDDHNPSPNAR